MSESERIKRLLGAGLIHKDESVKMGPQAFIGEEGEHMNYLKVDIRAVLELLQTSKKINSFGAGQVEMTEEQARELLSPYKLRKTDKEYPDTPEKIVYGQVGQDKLKSKSGLKKKIKDIKEKCLAMWQSIEEELMVVKRGINEDRNKIIATQQSIVELQKWQYVTDSKLEELIDRWREAKRKAENE